MYSKTLRLLAISMLGLALVTSTANAQNRQLSTNVDAVIENRSALANNSTKDQLPDGSDQVLRLEKVRTVAQTKAIIPGTGYPTPTTPKVCSNDNQKSVIMRCSAPGGVTTYHSLIREYVQCTMTQTCECVLSYRDRGSPRSCTVSTGNFTGTSWEYTSTPGGRNKCINDAINNMEDQRAAFWRQCQNLACSSCDSR
jgi:hypothetical protein